MIGKEGIYKIDYLLVTVVTLVVALGILMIYSAGFDPIDKVNNGMYKKQILWFIFGFILMLVVTFVNYQHLGDYSLYIYGILLVLLLITTIFGTPIRNTRAWLSFGFFSVPLAYEKGAKKISLYDLDPTTRDISNWINGVYKPEFNHHIVNTTFDYDMMDQSADVWINTSCEHSYPMKDILPSGKLCVMSGNGLTKRGHINLINSIEELKEQCELSLVIDEDEIVFQYEDELGKRDYSQYMIIGIK